MYTTYILLSDILLSDIRNLFEHEEEENYYKPVTSSQ